MNDQRTDDFSNWLGASAALIATRPVLLVVPLVFDLIALLVWNTLSWVLLGELKLPAGPGGIRLELIQALPSAEMIMDMGRHVAVGDPPRLVGMFVLATLVIAVIRAYGMAGFVGWLDRSHLIRGADLSASTFHRLGRRFFGPMAGYTLLWAAVGLLKAPVATTRLASFLFSMTELAAGAALMFTPYAILCHATYTLDAMVASVDFAWRNRRLVAGLVVFGFLATAAGSYVARSAAALLGVAGFFIAMVLWTPVGSLLSAVSYAMYLDCEEES